MNGVTLLGLSAKESSDSCDLGARAVSERVVRSWSRLECGTAHTVRYATIAVGSDGVTTVTER